MSHLAETIDIERDGLRYMLEAVAVARETDAEARRDHRYGEAARSIRLIASTLHQIDDAAMVDVAMINEASDGMASKLITARLLTIGFELPPFGSAAEFLAGVRAADRESTQTAAAMRADLRAGTLVGAMWRMSSVEVAIFIAACVVMVALMMLLA